VSDPAAGSPRGGSAGPAPPGTAGGGPRDDGDGIAVDIATRAGLVTVQFTGRGHARACPAAGQAFTYNAECWTDAPTAVPNYLSYLQNHNIGMTAYQLAIGLRAC
jgi:hypothetical protein